MMRGYPSLAKRYGENDPHSGEKAGNEGAEPTWYQPNLLAEAALQQFASFQTTLQSCDPTTADWIRRHAGVELGLIERQVEDSDF